MFLGIVNGTGAELNSKGGSSSRGIKVSVFRGHAVFFLLFSQQSNDN